MGCETELVTSARSFDTAGRLKVEARRELESGRGYQAPPPHVVCSCLETAALVPDRQSGVGLGNSVPTGNRKLSYPNPSQGEVGVGQRKQGRKSFREQTGVRTGFSSLLHHSGGTSAQRVRHLYAGTCRFQDRKSVV